jgi:hypothetical protein
MGCQPVSDPHGCLLSDRLKTLDSAQAGMTAFRRGWRWWMVGAALAVATPSFADLRITTQHSLGLMRATEALSLKGARQRNETTWERPGFTERRGFTITQCDRQRTVRLNVAAKLYGISPLWTRSPWLWSRPAPPEGEGPVGAVVTTTFDAVDTGERRTIGHYVARRVHATVTVEPSPDAHTPRSTRETDGWYIDVPGIGCRRKYTESFASVVVNHVGGVPDRQIFQTKRTAKRGYPIEETTRFSQGGVTHVDSITLISISEDQLDSSLFEIPGDYRPALPFINGGFDMERPDTIANRLHLYSEQVAMLIRSWTERVRARATTKRTP